MLRLRLLLVGILTVAVPFATGVYAWKVTREKRAQAFRLELALAKERFAREAVGVRMLSDDAYTTGVAALLRGYAATLDEIERRHPEQSGVVAAGATTTAAAVTEVRTATLALAQAPGEAPAQTPTQAQAPTATQRPAQAQAEQNALAQGLLARVRQDSYRPLYSASDKSFRFDILAITPETMSGEPRLKVLFATWGAFGPVTYGGIEGVFRGASPTPGHSSPTSPSLRNSVTPNGHGTTTPSARPAPPAIAKLVGESQPPNLVFDAAAFAPELPSGLALGYYDLPLCPREASELQLTFGLDITAAAGQLVPMRLVFPHIAIADAWKVADGARWQGEERVISDREVEATGGPKRRRATPKPAAAQTFIFRE